MGKNILSLAFQGVRRKKRSSLLILLVLLVSFSAAIVSISLVGSIGGTNAEFRLNTYGEWMFAIPSGRQSDVQWLGEQDWIEALGVSKNYGSIPTDAGLGGFGSVDDGFLTVGRVTLNQGKMPAEDHEIAMEADLLSALGYDYTLGQEIAVPILISTGEESNVLVERTYTLCGVLREYTNLWVLNRNAANRLLVSAVVTENAAEQVLEEARSLLDGEDGTVSEAVPQYFMTVREENRDAARETLEGWLRDSRDGSVNEDKFPCVNTVAYPEYQGEDYNTVYLILIAAVTVIAVLCVYLMQLPSESHSFAVLRSVGITRVQLAGLLLTETLLLSLPAVLLGIPCGAGLTWLVLRLMLYSGSVPIRVEIPYDTLGRVILLWLAAVLVSRILVYAAAVRLPLTGRLQMQHAKSRRAGRLRNVLIVLLLAVFGAVLVFTGVKSARPAYLREYWSLCPSYTIWKNEVTENWDEIPVTVSERDAALLRQAPGVSRVDGFGEQTIRLSFEGLEETEAHLYALDADGWDETFDFDPDREAFRAGELVLLCLPEEGKDEYPLPADGIQLAAYERNQPVAQIGTAVSVRYLSDDVLNRGLAYLWEPYTVICSQAFLQELLNDMEPGTRWGRYTAGAEFGYGRVYAMADLNSGYLSTDMSMASLCQEKGFSLDNRRETFVAEMQEQTQSLIMLYVCGGCIALVALLILGSAMSLEAEQETRRFAVLRAIGMSSRQMEGRILGKALLRSGLALLTGWLLYFLYSVVTLVQAGETLPYAAAAFFRKAGDYIGLRPVLASALCVLLPLLVSLLAKRRLKKGAMNL